MQADGGEKVYEIAFDGGIKRTYCVTIGPFLLSFIRDWWTFFRLWKEEQGVDGWWLYLV